MDHFWDVRQQEAEEEKRVRLHVATIEAELSLAQRSAALRGAAGFADFMKALERLRDGVQRKLNFDQTLTDANLRETRGILRGITETIGLLTNPKVVQHLAEQLEAAQNHLGEVLKRRPKPRASEPPEDEQASTPP